MKQPQKRAQILLAVALLLYACGYVTQFIGNYAVWQKNGGMLGGTSPPFPSLSPLTCLKGVLWFPYNLYCMAGCAAAVAVIFLYRKLFSQDALTDSERNFDFSAKGTYGTSGWMQTREVPAVLDMVSDLSQHTGTVLGMLDGKFLCIPEKTRMNGNLAVYGASGSMKTRSFCMNRILQSAARGESLIICDPKSELYEKSSEYMRDLGYTVRVFNLVSPENSDSWNCLKEIEGQELMAQLFVDVIIKNTNGTGKSDRFWDSGEMNLLKALVLYVDLTYPPEQRTIGEVYNLITQCSESQLDSLFDVLPLTHPAKAPYSLYQRASDSVRSGVISGLGSRLQVFQSDLIKKITAYDEISLELPGQQHCAYYLVTSDQDSTFDFLASLFLSFAFIKLVRYADANCPGGRLPVPVHVLGEELTACGTISELSRRISVIRSRNISMSCVFQNLAGLQNRYPQNQWQEILGNCDVQLFLGCTDQLTAEYVSQRTGIASVAVSSTSKALSTLRVSDYTPQYRESSGVGKRSVLTPDEVLRLPVDEALVILRGHKVLKVRKMDYSLHPAYKQLRECKAFALTEDEAAAAVDAQGKDAVSGNLFLWLLCAIAFLKVSTKLDGILHSLGIGVSRSPGSMLSEALLAFRGFEIGKAFMGLGAAKAAATTAATKTTPGNTFAGGLSGGIGASLGGTMYHNSLGKDGGFASKVIGSIATGQTSGCITGDSAVEALNGYFAGTSDMDAMQIPATGENIPTAMATAESDAVTDSPIPATPLALEGDSTVDVSPTRDSEITMHAGGSPAVTEQTTIPTSSSIQQAAMNRVLLGQMGNSVTDVEIGGGKIQGREIIPGRGQIQFAMYNARRYEKPEGHFTEQTSRDGEKWYKVYATTRVEKTPTVQDERGRMQYDERKVAAMPKAPARRH